MLFSPVFAKLQPRSVPRAAPCACTPPTRPTVCKLATLRTPRDACIPFLFNRSSSHRLRRRPTERCLSPLFPCPCPRFPSQQGGTPPPPILFPTPACPEPPGVVPESFDPVGETLAFHQSPACPERSRGVTSHRFSPPYHCTENATVPQCF